MFPFAYNIICLTYNQNPRFWDVYIQYISAQTEEGWPHTHTCISAKELVRICFLSQEICWLFLNFCFSTCFLSRNDVNILNSTLLIYTYIFFSELAGASKVLRKRKRIKVNIYLLYSNHLCIYNNDYIFLLQAALSVLKWQRND